MNTASEILRQHQIYQYSMCNGNLKKKIRKHGKEKIFEEKIAEKFSN